MIRTGPLVRFGAALALLACCGEAAGAHNVRLEIGDVDWAGLSASDVVIAIQVEDDEAVHMSLAGSRLALSPALILRDLSITCAGTLTAQAISCTDGEIRGREAGTGTVEGRVSFRYGIADRAIEISTLRLSLAGIRLHGSLAYRARGWNGELHAAGIDLSRLRGLVPPLEPWLADFSGESGRVDIDVVFAGENRALTRAQGSLRAAGVGFHGPGSAENMDAWVDFRLHRDDGWNVTADATLAAGLLYLEPGVRIGELRPGIVLDASGAPIRADVDLNWKPDTDALLVRRMELDHPGVVQAELAGEVHTDTTMHIVSADLSLSNSRVQPFYETYIQPFLLGSLFSELEAAGMLDAAASVRNGELENLRLVFHDVHAYDGQERISIAGLDGTLRLHDGTTPVRSTLRWAGLGMYKLNFGAGSLVVESSSGDIRVLDWADMPFLDGGVKIDSLTVSRAGRPGMRIALDGSITPVSVADLTQALDWPIMSGTLTGTLRGLTYERGTLAIDGRIRIGLFDGIVDVTHLRIDELFGPVPALNADVDVDNIDLELLTERFSFGRIEGRLDGYIRNLVLHAWQPVSFEAELATPEDDDSRHRISQRAVDNLGYLGGGATSALSSGLLRIFKNYSYGRLGVGCRLFNGACELSGVENTPDGFLILTRGGILPPWIEVKGAGRIIQWRALIEGFRNIATNPVEIR